MSASTNGRERPWYLKHPDGGWITDYEGRSLRAVRRPFTEDPNAKWAVYEVTGNSPETVKELFLAEGPKCDTAVFKAMDKLDKNDPRKPLRDEEMAAWCIKVSTMAYPDAVNFEPVRTGDSLTGEVVGWTFHVDKGSVRRFGWVAVDRRKATALEDYREDAVVALVATVSTSPAEHLALPARAAATSRAVMALPVERGTCPRYVADPVVNAALEALGKNLPHYHPMRLPLAEVTDRYEIRERETYPAAARGALVLPEEGPVVHGARVFGYWLEGGEWFRPRDIAASVPLQVIAERLSKAGFSIESVRDGRVSALYHAPEPEGGDAATEYGDVWSLSNGSGFEIAVIEGGSDDTMMDLARCLPHVRVTIENEGGVVRRRLSRWEIERRRAAGDDPADLAIHHCEERGHQECGSGTRLVELDPQGHGRITPAPVREVEAADGGTVPERQLPTYVKGTWLLGIDGKRHQVWETVWREWDGAAVETVLTTTGEEHPAARLVEFEGGQRRVETDAHKGDTAAERSPILSRSPLADICPPGHPHVTAAAEALEAFRTGPVEDREKWEKAAEEAALWAAAWFFQGTGELTVGMWRTVVRCAVELYARRFTISRPHALDPEPERNSFFGAGRRSLEDRSPEGYQQVLSAARHWVRSLNSPWDAQERESADRAMWKAAEAFAAEFGTEDANEWVAPVRYLAEVHAMTLVDEGIAKWSRGER
ncbi:hypothetical protein [Streptomyces violaceusniger]|uniref:Uncharacterized protein n=1 Tax=Streptomyces violaceusniger (strain Tu 4113) TaxID=653045 RepID=G2PHS6_STRV4|nr:hypothetical protein [Streptomyces violaceusniger]AEM88877.1 hypothetical protein Strvi_0101 [Streptomyces violaceusniger Tu 4113]